MAPRDEKAAEAAHHGTTVALVNAEDVDRRSSTSSRPTQLGDEKKGAKQGDNIQEKQIDAGDTDDAADCVVVAEDKSQEDVEACYDGGDNRGRLSATFSRIASHAGSALHRYHDGRGEPLARLPTAPLPLTDLGRGMVGWDSPDDPAMPLNFSVRRKYTIIVFLAAITLVTPFSSSMLSPSINLIHEDFHESVTVASLAVSIYLLGYAVGPLFLAGLSEIYGRHIVLNASNVFFCAWQVGCALAPSIQALTAFRFLAGVGGSGSMTLGGAYIGDLFPIEERGTALSVWSLGSLIGPSIGPIAGAWLAQTIGWRWGFWVVLIPGSICTIVIAVFSTETSHRVLIKRKVKRLSKQLGRTDLYSCYDDINAPPVPLHTILLRNLTRPLKMLFLSPMLLTLSLYFAFAYGVLYLLFNTVSMVFQEGYGWSIGIVGLVYIPLGLGYAIGLLVFASMSDRTVVRLAKKNNGVVEPEMRLVDCIYFACCLPITFFWYGWSAYYQVHWIVPVLGLFPYGFAIIGLWQPLQAYIIDGYGYYSASGLAAFAVLRSIVAAFLPLAGPDMYDTLGVGWGNSVLGFLCIAMIPIPLLAYRYGGWLRKRFPLDL